jgi:hypothetical protein
VSRRHSGHALFISAWFIHNSKARFGAFLISSPRCVAPAAECTEGSGFQWLLNSFKLGSLKNTSHTNCGHSGRDPESVGSDS